MTFHNVPHASSRGSRAGMTIDLMNFPLTALSVHVVFLLWLDKEIDRIFTTFLFVSNLYKKNLSL